MRRSLRLTLAAIGIGLTVSIVVICAWATRSIWLESYGPGPPYFGRTVNMDKWEDPTAQIALVNGLGVVLVGGIGLVLKRTRWASRSR